MLINRLTWGPIPGGVLSGIMAYQAHVTGEEGSPREVADIVMAIHQHVCGPGKFISLYGNFTEENALDITTLIAALRGYGYRVGIVSWGGKYVFPFFRDVQYTAVRLEPSTVWAAFPCGEIIYRVYEPEDLLEPTLPGDVSNTALFLQPSSKLSVKQVYDFVRTAKHVWNVITPDRTPRGEKVYDGLEENQESR